jgi:hypothetical protein
MCVLGRMLLVVSFFGCIYLSISFCGARFCLSAFLCRRRRSRFFLYSRVYTRERALVCGRACIVGVLVFRCSSLFASLRALLADTGPDIWVRDGTRTGFIYLFPRARFLSCVPYLTSSFFLFLFLLPPSIHSILLFFPSQWTRKY